jgi:hypothetical protein
MSDNLSRHRIYHNRDYYWPRWVWERPNGDKHYFFTFSDFMSQVVGGYTTKWEKGWCWR